MHCSKRAFSHFFAAALSLGLLAAQSPQSNNSVKIKDEDGNNIANPTVQLLNATDDSKSKKGDGDYKADFAPANLADGDYKVCVNMPATLFINPCLWKNNPPIVNVKNGKLPANFSVTAERGVSFKIHVNDQFERKSRQTDASTHIGPAGKFQFTGLSDGSYALCVQPSGTIWLDSCEWGHTVIAVAITSNNKNPTVVVTLKKGVAVPIRIDDATQLLSKSEGKTPGAHVLIGFINPASAFRHATLLSNVSTGRNHQIVIPFDTPVNLVVSNSFFQVRDNAVKSTPAGGVGVTIPSTGKIIPLLVPTGKAPPAISLSVTAGGRP